MKRPHISAKTKVDVAIRQAGGVKCPLCLCWMDADEPRILEHLVPHELGGSSEADNLSWVHKDCASEKTNGSKATSAGGDIHKIAKAKRLSAAQAIHAAIIAGDMTRAKSRIPSRPFQKRMKP